MLPGWRLGLATFASKPEFYLQIASWVELSHLVRPGVLVVCAALNLGGIATNVLHTRRTLFIPYNHETMRQDVVKAEGELMAAKLDAIQGYTPDSGEGDDAESQKAFDA
jgi:hypothetical protein